MIVCQVCTVLGTLIVFFGPLWFFPVAQKLDEQGQKEALRQPHY